VHKIYERLHEPTVKEVHVSISGSGSLECSRAEGGKAAYITEIARDISNVRVYPKDLGPIVGLYDCFGEVVVQPDCAYLAVSKIIKDEIVVWGDLLYTPFIELTRRKFDQQQVPFGLAKILLLSASSDIRKFGCYKFKEVDNFLGVPLFKEKNHNKFIPNIEAIPVKASISVESAMKSRFVTSNPAAYTQLGQPINHFMRQWLSQDPFCRIGFDEGDKLWELLNSYAKYYSTGQFQRDIETNGSPDFGVH
jgi:hypothetical protein